MLRIRRIYDDILPLNREMIMQVKEILRTRFNEVSEEEIEQIGLVVDDCSFLNGPAGANLEWRKEPNVQKRGAPRYKISL